MMSDPDLSVPKKAVLAGSGFETSLSSVIIFKRNKIPCSIIFPQRPCKYDLPEPKEQEYLLVDSVRRQDTDEIFILKK